MDPSSAHHHHQEMSSQTLLESMMVCTNAQQEKKPRPPEESLKCPRCDSTNTKFCYYNNYSLTQPRYFCKACRRYWTKGGTLRNVPVGGGCRKNKRSSSSSASKMSQDQPLSTNPSPLISNFSPLSYDCNDLTNAFARLQKQTSGQLGFDDDHHEYDLSIMRNPNNTYFDNIGDQIVNTSATNPGFFNALRTGFLQTPQNAVHNLYYGNGNGNYGGLGLNFNEGMAMTFEEMSGATTTATTVTTVKQELSTGREGENRVLWGFPWQQLGGDGNMGGLDSGRQSWNGLGSSWHGGLLNSPLL